METVKNLEKTIAKWYESAPHLPNEAKKWLAENVWWLTLIGVIVGAIGVLSLLFFTVLTGAFLTAIAGGVGAVIGGLIMIGVLGSLILSVISVFLGGLAINPLKALQKKGWVLLFIIFLLEIVAIIVSNIFTLNIFSMVWSLLWAAVGGYLLFEVRSYFGQAKVHHGKKVAAEKK
jgi:hypothetical protein